MDNDFYGLPTRSLGNAALRLEFLAEAGPRIVRLFLAGTEGNQLAEVPTFHWGTPYGDYYPRGGHRLWHAPEALLRSYVPDDTGLQAEELADGVRLMQPTEAPTGIRKTLEIHLHEDRPALTLVHRLQNEGPCPIELAPWAITQVPLGGTVVLPLRAPGQNPGALTPDRHLVLWPYTRWQDSRLRLDDDYLLVETEPQPAPFKIGCFDPLGWLGYLRQGVFFCKRFEPCPGQDHADLGCNVEVYSNELFAEMETLGPLCSLQPGQTATHEERWEFYTGLPTPATREETWDVASALRL